MTFSLRLNLRHGRSSAIHLPVSFKLLLCFHTHIDLHIGIYPRYIDWSSNSQLDATTTRRSCRRVAPEPSSRQPPRLGSGNGPKKVQRQIRSSQITGRAVAVLVLILHFWILDSAFQVCCANDRRASLIWVCVETSLSQDCELL